MDKAKTMQASDGAVKLIDKTVKVPEVLDDFGNGLVAVIDTIDEQLENGWQPTDDVPAILTSLVKDLSSKLANLKAMAAEVKGAPIAAVRSIGITVTDAVEKVLD
jgi:hypothetical protein